MLRSIGFATCLALLLIGCGGGGGGGPNSPGQPTITAGSPPAGATGVVYPGYTFTVASGGASPFTWSETGALPPGLALSSAGQLTGTPVTAGTYAITVMVADSSNPALTGTLPVSLQIDASPIVVSPGQTPPAGVHGTPYSFTFAATGGNLPLSWTITAGTLPPGLTLGANGSLTGTPTKASSTPFAFTVTVTDSSAPTPATNSVAYAITVSEPAPPSMFMQTGSMTVARVAHSATLLQNGQVLIAGGIDASSSLASAELYDPPSQVFIATGSLTIARSGHTATLLANAALPNYGKVLVAGGGSETAELYDPTTGTFAATGSMVAPRSGQTATLLLDGRVLIAGGGASQTAELYDPTTGTFAATGSMVAPHYGQAATLLLDGRVLMAGSNAELFNPSTGTFTATGSMSKVGPAQTATLLLDGTVLVTDIGNSAELFSPATGTFSLVGGLLTPLTPGFGITATLRNDGTVLVAGGRIVAFSGHFHADHSIAAAELFATQSEAFTATDSLLAPREGHTATLLADGTVLVAGGVDYSENCHIGGCSPITLVLSSAELFK